MLIVNDFSPAPDQAATMASIQGASQACFVGAMLAEIAAAASVDQMQGFFFAVGQRLATIHPIGAAQAVDGFMQHSAHIWQKLGWGDARFELNDDSIDIFHRGLPMRLESDAEGQWLKVAPFVLRGAYDGWFRQMGSGARFRTTIVRMAGSEVELRHGV